MAAPQAPTLAEAAGALAQCRESLRVGSHTFFLASLMLPRAVRVPASGLYAFCRLADDAVDEGSDKAGAVARLRRRLDAVYGHGGTRTGVDRAFAAVAAHFAIPRALPAALLEGFEWDAQERQYDTLGEVQDYAARVAGSVGAMMALVMGVREPQALARACELGVAMQLSNIARDVGEDAAAGRLYLPRDWMREEGVDPQAWLAAPAPCDGVARVVARLLGVAEGLYAGAAQGVDRLPLACRPGIQAARLLYAEIGRQVARNGHDGVSRRAVVGRRRKAAVLGRVLLELLPRASVPPHAALPAIAFLVEAVQHEPLPARPSAGLVGRMDERAGFVVDLCLRLGQAERGQVARVAQVASMGRVAR